MFIGSGCFGVHALCIIIVGFSLAVKESGFQSAGTGHVTSGSSHPADCDFFLDLDSPTCGRQGGD